MVIRRYIERKQRIEDMKLVGTAAAVGAISGFLAGRLTAKRAGSEVIDDGVKLAKSTSNNVYSAARAGASAIKDASNDLKSGAEDVKKELNK